MKKEQGLKYRLLVEMDGFLKQMDADNRYLFLYERAKKIKNAIWMIVKVEVQSFQLEK